MRVDIPAADGGVARVAGGPLARQASKRSLVALSHAMERALVSGRDAGGSAGTGAALLLGSFQRRAFFDAQVDRYRALADSGVTVLAVFVGDLTGLPENIHAISIPPSHPLARCWALVGVNGELGTALVANEVPRIVVENPLIGRERAFEARWTFQRRLAATEASDLLAQVAGLVQPAVLEAAQSVITHAIQHPVSTVEARLSEATEALVRSLEEAYLRAAILRERLDSTRQEAEADELTGLRNRHYLNRILRSMSDCGSLPLGALLVDVDDLKVINDRLGHSAGDAALRGVAEAIRQTSRPGDILVRWGGDEFLMLLPGTNLAEASLVGERLVRTVRDLSPSARMAGAPPLAMSISIGVGTVRGLDLPLDELDTALRAAKVAGKGRASTGRNGAHDGQGHGERTPGRETAGT